MDEFINQFFIPSSWTDDNVSERSSWIDDGLDQGNELLCNTRETYKGVEKNLPAHLIASGHIEDSLLTDGASIFVGEDSSFDLEKSLLLGECCPQQHGIYQDSKPSLLGVMDRNSNSGYGDELLNTTSTVGILDYGSPELLPLVIDPATLPSVQPESGSVGSNDSEPSVIQPTLRDSNSFSSAPQLWSPSTYGGVSTMPPGTMQEELQGLGLQGQYVENGATLLGNINFRAGPIPQGSLPALLSVNGQHKLNNQHFPSFADGYQIPPGRTAGIHPQMQLPRLDEGNSFKHYTEQSTISHPQQASATGGCNGAVKPRVRARRGQATDPHSIAERLRREKIAERMKNLQELVPNTNRTDKASMLDEIIEYVRFLQLQVKVLSMSRLGAAGAVVPLLTDSQAEGSTGVLLSQRAGLGLNPFDSPEDLAFEQEVVKLMESNMSKAIQFLQSKGLSLMPVALAAAISGIKTSQGKKATVTNRFAHHNNSLGSIGSAQVSSDEETRSNENMSGVHNREDVLSDGCNGAIIKQEDAMNNVRLNGA